MVAGNGTDTIAGFSGFGQDGDRIQLQGTGWTSFADLLAHSQQVGGNVVITTGDGGQLTLSGVQLGALVAADFNLLF